MGATIALSGSTLTISWRATGRRIPAHTGPNLVRVQARERWSIALLEPRSAWPVAIAPPDAFARELASEAGQLSRADVESARVSTCTRGEVAAFRLENRVGSGEWFVAEAREQQWRVRALRVRGACEEALSLALGASR
ncbi:MAG: hypothetical protein U0269_17800 [Polyangiales bacterium]